MKSAGKIGFYMGKKWITTLIRCIKIISRQIEDLKVKA